ncbi:MAG: hypothetical protein AB7O13_03010 [Alphaproteobacteria bacterium]
MSVPSNWLRGLRRYLVVTAIANLFWETAHLPLYTIWTDGTLRENVFAVLHCTGGDVLIALSAWAFAILVAGRPGWPVEATWRVAVLTVIAGFTYTLFSEWLNTTVRQSWTYSPWMPVLPGLGTGLSPAFQWLVIPSLALWAAGRDIRRGTVPGLAP